MKFKTRTWLLIAAALIVLGAALFALVMTVVDWDFMALSTTEYETNTHEVSEEFSGISLFSREADVVFLPSEDTVCRVVCNERVKQNHTVSVIEGVLTVRMVDEEKWYDRVEIFNFGSPKIEVYLPATHYYELSMLVSSGDVKVPDNFHFEKAKIETGAGDVSFAASLAGALEIRTGTGDIALEGVRAGALLLHASSGEISAKRVNCAGAFTVEVGTGNVTAEDAYCAEFTSHGGTGELHLKNVMCGGKLLVERSTGDVTLYACDAKELYITTSTGDVVGTLLSEKQFAVSTNTGKVEVAHTTAGGTCEINTDTGDIKISLS